MLNLNVLVQPSFNICTALEIIYDHTGLKNVKLYFNFKLSTLLHDSNRVNQFYWIIWGPNGGGGRRLNQSFYAGSIKRYRNRPDGFGHSILSVIHYTFFFSNYFFFRNGQFIPHSLYHLKSINQQIGRLSEWHDMRRRRSRVYRRERDNAWKLRECNISAFPCTYRDRLQV